MVKRLIRFEVPTGATSLELSSIATGTPRVLRTTTEEIRETETILDTGDNRLLRCDVTLSHQASGKTGNWQLAAPSWEPHLPRMHRQPAVNSDRDLPGDLLSRIEPITRAAPLGPIATLQIVRRTHTLFSEDESEIGAIRDHHVTIDRETLGSYREVVVEVSSAMTGQQLDFLLESMTQMSANPVDSFPTLQQRLGPPATGLTDFPVPEPLRRFASLEELVSHVFADDLRQLVTAMLDAAAGNDTASELNRTLLQSKRHLLGLSHFLRPAWHERMLELLPAETSKRCAGESQTLLRVIDALVSEAKAPNLGDAAGQRASAMLYQHAEHAVSVLRQRCDSLTKPEVTNQEWEAAGQAAQQLLAIVEVLGALPNRSSSRLPQELEAIASQLEECLMMTTSPDLTAISARQAFELGQQTERSRVAATRARREFVDEWPEQANRIQKMFEKSRPR